MAFDADRVGDRAQRLGEAREDVDGAWCEGCATAREEDISADLHLHRRIAAAHGDEILGDEVMHRVLYTLCDLFKGRGRALRLLGPRYGRKIAVRRVGGVLRAVA